MYRHQWLNLSAPSLAALTPYTYSSVMGELKLLDGNVFSTTLVFDGILNALPNKQADNAAFMQQLTAYLDAAPTGTPNPDTYFNGKEMARLAELSRVANAAGEPAQRDRFIAALRPVMEDWLTYSGPDDKKLFYYDPTWSTLIGYEASYGSDTLLNDHHFHYGYFLSAAAALADNIPNWGDTDEWGGMVDLLIKDVANADRDDTRFPFLRFFDPMAGHSWASGAANAADGNNQESSSEAVNFAAGLILWGDVTGNDKLRDLGIFLYANETAATQQYWFDIDGAVRQHGPSANGRTTPWITNGIVWGAKGTAVTYFGASAACVVGINLLPITGGSLYLGQSPSHVQAVYDQVAAAYDAFRCWAPLAGTDTPPPPAGADDWGPFFWQYRSFSDPVAAAAMFTDTVPYLNDISSGTSPAQVYYWLQNMAALGTRVTSITADNPLHAVFARHDGMGNVTLTYVVHSHDDASGVVTFSDGTQVTTAPNSIAVATRELRYPLYFPRVERQ
jgi:endoglucanase Acf2